MPTPCFYLEPTEKVKRSLRRYRSGSVCPFPGNQGYHQTMVFLDFVSHPPRETIPVYEIPHDHPFWPGSCLCGEPFTDADTWRVFPESVYRRQDNGEETTLRDAPAGAMWDAWWLGETYKGPDGLCLTVKTPGGEWVVDGPQGWQRTGTVPKITARPSIGITGDNGVWKYHAFLTDGVLVEC